MSLRDWLQKVIYRLGPGTAMSGMDIPPGWNYEQYLRAYGEVGWLFGSVSIIAGAVAKIPWHLYVVKDGDKEEVNTHPLLDMWSTVNPFQTKYQFVELLQMYLGLVGEGFIVLNMNQLNVPAEMWLAPPQYMHIIPSEDTYISHYEYRRGSSILRLEVPEVIHIFSPNPYNQYRGIGPAQSISTDLDTERYASRYQQRLFYNDATPGILIEYPEIPEPGERKKITQEWNDIHRGWRNARKAGFLWGGAKASTIALTNRDMEFYRLRKLNRETILGAFHIPTSIMGLAEVGSRARAEADEYIFAKYTVMPALTRIQEALNEQLVPLYDEKLRFEFEDPTPEDRTVLVDEVSKLVPYGIITREEGRQKLGYDPKPAKGETLLEPMNLLPSQVRALGSNLLPFVKAFTEEQKEIRWRAYAIKTERQEMAFKRTFKKLWDAQAEIVADRFEQYGTLEEAFQTEPAVKEFDEKLKPEIEAVFSQAFGEAVGLDLGRAYGAKQEGVLNQEALEWIAARSLSLAKMVNGTTKEELRPILAEGFAEGESTEQIKRRIADYYANGYERRARLVARTEVIAASNEGSIMGYEQEGIKKLEFYAALDERTCDDCMSYHAHEYPISESHGLIPVHPQCRCTWVPVVE